MLVFCCFFPLLCVRIDAVYLVHIEFSFVLLSHESPFQTLCRLLSYCVGPVCRKAFKSGELNQIASFDADPKEWHWCCISVVTQRGVSKYKPRVCFSLWVSTSSGACITTYSTSKICWSLIYTDIRNCRYVDNRNHGFTKDCSLPWKCH